ncbi:hypothetical protein F4819DRAFT_468245 [Hypoxylon fuscum]|nr:hypothetical protein F4819DRAFT_468245 [Hypoxylon fuscum]
MRRLKLTRLETGSSPTLQLDDQYQTCISSPRPSTQRPPPTDLHPMGAIAIDTQRLLRRPVSASTPRAYSTQPPKGPNATVKFWPFVAIIVIGTAGYIFTAKSMAKSRNTPIRRNSISNAGPGLG